jgi:hypothetical protein
MLSNSTLLSTSPHVLIGTIDEQRALAIIETIPTDKLQIKEIKEQENNDVYKFMNVELTSDARVTVICPATGKDQFPIISKESLPQSDTKEGRPATAYMQSRDVRSSCRLERHPRRRLEVTNEY